MAESLINTKRRISTIKSTEKITKAMKLVASVKFQRWKHYLEDDKNFCQSMTTALRDTLRCVDFGSSSLPICLRENDAAESTLYVLVTSSLGLCGAYNYQIYKALDPILKEKDEILFIGTKGYSHYKNKGYEHIDDYVGYQDGFDFSKAKRIRHEIIRRYKSGKYSSVRLVYTSYKNSMTFIPKTMQLLPLDLEYLEIEKNEGTKEFGPEMLPQQDVFIETMSTHYLDAIIYNRLLESQLSELASRRNAMESATDSAEKIINQLQIVYNKTRQGAITQEITEIVGGANAGKDKDK